MTDKRKPTATDDAPPPAPPAAAWTDGQRRSVLALAEIEPDLSEMVDNRRQWRKFWAWLQRITHGVAEFVKWAAMIGGAVAGAKLLLAGWLK